MMTCTVSNCDRKHYAKAMCFAHYKRARAGRSMDAPIQLRNNDAARFAQKVDKTSGCWNWTAGVSLVGYGTFRYQSKMMLAHRVSYEWSVGPIPEGMEIDHICHNRKCVNPDHLRVADSALNKQNRSGATRLSKSGVRGVTWYAKRGKWMAKATVRGEQHYLGWFTSIEEATAAVTDWRRDNMPYSVADQKKAV